jgi:hypothetical protein
MPTLFGQDHPARYSTVDDCYVAILQVLMEIDYANEYVKEVRIWRFAEEAKTKSPFGWHVQLGRSVTWNGEASKPHDTARRREVALVEALKAYQNASREEKKANSSDKLACA